jgi:hypothetical protein
MIYPLIKNDVMVHDVYARFPDEDAIIVPFTGGEGFIGEVYTGDPAPFLTINPNAELK